MCKRLLLFSTCLLLAVGLTSCATLFTGTTDNITIDSEPEGARILIEGIDYGTTPATVSVKRPGLGDKQVVLQLDGYEDRVFTLQKEFNAVSILNFGGFVGWVVDFATGAVTKYSPRHYSMELRRAGVSYSLDELPRDEEGRIVLPADQNVLVRDEANGLTLLFENRP